MLQQIDDELKWIRSHLLYKQILDSTLDYFRTVPTLWATHRCQSCYPAADVRHSFLSIRHTKTHHATELCPRWMVELLHVKPYIYLPHFWERKLEIVYIECDFQYVDSLLSERAGNTCLYPGRLILHGDKNRGPTICIVEGYVGDGMVSVRGEAKLIINKHNCK